MRYEGQAFPEEAGWERIVFTEIDRQLENGWFIHFVDFANEVDSYRRSLANFAGVPALFVEWRVESDAPKSGLDVSATPVVVVAGGFSAAFYHTTITDSRVQIFRDTSIPLVFVDVEPGVAHTYYLELRGATSYAWYIDGTLVDAGVPLGPYPRTDSTLTWGTTRQMHDSTTRWDYVRYGVIPIEGSGDFDSDGAVTGSDYVHFHECLTNQRQGINGGPDNDAGPGCRFADFDLDDDVDLRDFAGFQASFTGEQ